SLLNFWLCRKEKPELTNITCHTLAKLLISANPNIAYNESFACDVVKPLELNLFTEKEPLQQFEGLLALTNLSSVSNVVRLVIFNKCDFLNIETFIYSENENLRRASVECLCNLVMEETNNCPLSCQCSQNGTCFSEKDYPNKISRVTPFSEVFLAQFKAIVPETTETISDRIKFHRYFSAENDRVKLILLYCLGNTNEEHSIDEKLVLAASGLLATISYNSTVCKKIPTLFSDENKWIFILMKLLINENLDIVFRGISIVYNLFVNLSENPSRELAKYVSEIVSKLKKIKTNTNVSKNIIDLVNSISDIIEKKKMLLIYFFSTLCFGILLSPYYSQGFLPPLIKTTDYQRVLSIPDGTNGILLCSAVATPTARYEWYIDDKIIRNRDGISIKNVFINGIQSSVLNITNILANNEGFYRCHAINEYGRDVSDLTRVIKIVNINAQIGTNELHVALNGDVIIDCPKINPIYKVQYNWYIANGDRADWIRIEESDRFINSEGNLYLLNVVDSDFIFNNEAKLYKRGVFIPGLQKEIFTCSSILIQKGQTDKTKPTIMYSSKNIYNLGDNAKLYCVFTGYPKVDTHWQSLLVNNKMPAKFSSENAYLLIYNVQLSDQGTYRCTGQNSEGETEIDVELIVTERPYFMTPLKIVYVAVGETARFKCNVYPWENLKIVWYVNGTPVESDDRRIENSNIFNQQTHPQLKGQNIQCNASNEYGYVYGSTFLKVLDLTKILNGPINKIIGEPGAYNLTCSATSDESETLNYEWKKQLQEGHAFEIKSTGIYSIFTNKTSTLTINSDTLDEILGVYTCRAFTDYSDATSQATISKGPEVDKIVSQLAISWMWIVFPLILILVLVVLMVMAILYYQRRGSTYNVDKKERATGNDPEKEIADSGFHDYRRVENPPVGGSIISIRKNISICSSDGKDDDFDKMGDESGLDPNKFNEDGSFTDQYNETYSSNRKLKVDGNSSKHSLGDKNTQV
ncbi:hypothetical protein A3Q56_00611, partial [Intoshia linei]